MPACERCWLEASSRQLGGRCYSLRELPRWKLIRLVNNPLTAAELALVRAEVERRDFAAAVGDHRDGAALSHSSVAAGVTDGSIGDQTRDPARTPPTATAGPGHPAASEVASEPAPTASDETPSNTTTTAAPAAGSRAVACRRTSGIAAESEGTV